MVVSDTCTQFLNHCRSAMSLSEHTHRAYGSDLKDAGKYFGSKKRIKAVTKEDLRQYIRHLREERKFKETSIKRRVACLKLLFRWAIRESIIATNPFDTLNERIRLPKRLPRALDRGHVRLLRKAITPTARSESFDALCRKTAIQLLLDTGIRVGELANVRIEDLSLPDRCLKVHGKGNRQRLVYLLSDPLYRSLGRYLSRREKLGSQSELLFVTEAGLDLTPQRVRTSLHEIATTAGIDRRLTPHMLRHTCATQWLEAGLDIRYVQKLLGHQSISTTEIYTHVSDQGLREALLRATGGQMR
jgi:site-specific recombinase XerD